jgi:hypothetical protein
VPADRADRPRIGWRARGCVRTWHRRGDWAVRELPAIPGDGIDAERYAEHLKILSSDEFEGRAPGTRGERLTLNYLVEEFAKLGLQPGYGDSYLQPVPMVELTNESRSTIEIVDEQGSHSLTYPEQMIIGTRRPGTSVHGVEDSELVFVGYGVVAPEYGWNDYEGLDVEGKTVIMLVNDPGYATGDPELFNGNAMTYYGRWTYKYEEAARQGAAAALIVHETEPASYGWEVVINSWSGAQFELGENGDEPIMALEGWITVDTAEALFERAGLDFQAEKPGPSPPISPRSAWMVGPRPACATACARACPTTSWPASQAPSARTRRLFTWPTGTTWAATWPSRVRPASTTAPSTMPRARPRCSKSRACTRRPGRPSEPCCSWP